MSSIAFYGTSPAGTDYYVQLPWHSGISFIFPRQSLERVSVAGNIIRQAAPKSVTTGTSRYSGLVEASIAETIYQMDFALTNAYLAFCNKVFNVQFDARIGDQIIAGKRAVDIEFKVIAQVV